MSGGEWRADKAWSDGYMIDVKRSLGEVLILDAPLAEDISHNTDLMMPGLRVLEARGVGAGTIRIGVRVRRSDVYESYADEFTIRSRRSTGTKTELEKILEGWGDLFFYGHADHEQAGKLAAWGVGRLDVFRAWHQARGYQRSSMDNTDRKTEFHAFKWRRLPSDFIIGERNLPGADAPKPFTHPAARDSLDALLKEAAAKGQALREGAARPPRQLGLFA